MKVLGFALIVLAIITVAVPQFTNCYYEGKAITLASGKTIPMKCLWTARAEAAVGIPLAAVGGMLFFSRRRESKINLSVVGAILGGVAVALPTRLIGVCSSDMACNTVMEPTLIGTGSLAIVASLAALVLSARKKADG